MAKLHVRGVLLPGDEVRDLWIEDGTLRTEPVPGAETLVDGGYILEGLVDAHCHIGLGADGPVELAEAVEQATIERAAGTLLIRDCGSPLDTRPLRQRDDLPRLIRAGRHLALPKRYIRYLGLELDSPDMLPAAVAEQAAFGDGWVKLVGDYIDRDVGDLAPLWPQDVLAEAIRVAHEAGARVTAHVFGEEALVGLLAAGIDCIEHGTGLTPGTIEMMAEAGAALVPTVINVVENFPGIAEGAAKYPRYAAHMHDLHARVVDTVGQAIDAGIDVFAGTDAGGGIANGRIADEVAALHAAGMSRQQAIGAASWNARRWLSRPGLFAGAPADFVVYPADPRDDLEILRSPSHIVLGGRPFPVGDLDRVPDQPV